MTIDSILKRIHPTCATSFYSLYGYYLEKTRYNKAYENVYNEIISHDKNWPIENRKAYQLKHLKNTIYQAINYVPYYREWAKNNNFHVQDLKKLTDISYFPILSQKTVKDNPHLFIHDNVRQMQVRWTKTGGTTGRGLSLPIDISCDHVAWASIWRSRIRFGISKKDWVAQFFGRDFIASGRKERPFCAKNFFGKQIFFSSHHISESTISDYVHTLNTFKPPMITGYPSVISRLASLIIDNGYLIKYTPRVICTSSENLLYHQRKVIEDVFHQKCVQVYGQTEQVASICTNADYSLEVDEELGFIEFIDGIDQGKKIIATGLHNNAFPLIRYDTGDYIDSYKIINGKRIVNQIEGREEDYLLTVEGNRIQTINQLFKSITNIEALQFQEKRSGYYKVLIIPASRDFSADIYTIRHEIESRNAGSIHLEFEIVDTIPTSKSGKMKLILRSTL